MTEPGLVERLRMLSADGALTSLEVRTMREAADALERVEQAISAYEKPIPGAGNAVNGRRRELAGQLRSALHFPRIRTFAVARLSNRS